MNKIVVPIDFTESTENALVYALSMANTNSDELILLYIIDDFNEQSAKSKMETLKDKVLKGYPGKVTLKILEGKINEQIGSFAEIVEATYIVMGIHKSSRLENLFGSKAIDVISKSKVPFIIVQNNTIYNGIKKIAMTIDLDKESIQVVKTASELASNFGAELILVAGDHTDSELKKKVTTNLRVAIDFLQKNNIKGSVKLLERKNFGDEFIQLCTDCNFDCNKVDS